MHLRGLIWSLSPGLVGVWLHGWMTERIKIKMVYGGYLSLAWSLSTIKRAALTRNVGSGSFARVKNRGSSLGRSVMTVTGLERLR